MYMSINTPMGLIHWDNPPLGGLMIQMKLSEIING